MGNRNVSAESSRDGPWIPAVLEEADTGVKVRP